nr:MAG TPA: hypothetical protein [Caudoviricetes sp.]
MKKVIALVISLVLLGSVAMAEIPDVSSLTDEELETLQKALSAEFSERGIEKSAVLTQGSYVCGQDIPAGSYLFSSFADKGHGIFAVYTKNEADYPSKYKVYDAASVKRDSSYYVTLEEGDVVEIPYQFKLTITTGIKFE